MALYNIHFPLSKGDNGFFAFNTKLEDAVRENVKNVIFTPKGTRINRPDYGTHVFQYLYEPMSASLKAKIKYDIQTSLIKWIRNIVVNAVEVYFKEDLLNSRYSSVVIDEQSVFVVVNYTIISNGGDVQIPNQAIGFRLQN